MTENRNEISPFQFYALFFISRIFGMLTFPNEGTANLSAGNGLLIALTYIPFTVLLSLPVFVLRKKSGGGCIDAFRRSHPAAARIVLFGYAAFFLLQSALCAMMLDDFSGVAMFQHGGHPFLLLLFFAIALITAITGMGTVARAVPLVLLFFVLTAGVLAAATLPYFEWENLSFPDAADAAGLIKNGLFAALRTAEPAGLLFCAVKKQKGAACGLPLTVCAVGGTISLLFTLIAGVTGAFGETQKYQFYTLTTLAELGTVERMDDLLCALWIFSAMLKSVFYLTLTLECFRSAGVFVGSKRFRLGLLAAQWGLYLLLTNLKPFQMLFTSKAGNLSAVFLFTALLPLLLLRTERKHGKKGGKTFDAA